VKRRLYVPIDYHHYSPHRVIVGLRRCPPHERFAEAGVLRAIAEASPGWQSLAVCAQHPNRWGKGWGLSMVAELDGLPGDAVPVDAWNPRSA